MADFGGLFALVVACLMMLLPPMVWAARANDRDLARLRGYVVLRRAHQAGMLRMPLQEAVDHLAAGRSVTDILEGRAA